MFITLPLLHCMATDMVMHPLCLRACKDLQTIASEWGPINKQLQGRQTFEAEWLLDAGAFNSRFHSLLDGRTGGQAKQQSLSHGHRLVRPHACTAAHARTRRLTVCCFVFVFF